MITLLSQPEVKKNDDPAPSLKALISDPYIQICAGAIFVKFLYSISLDICYMHISDPYMQVCADHISKKINIFILAVSSQSTCDLNDLLDFL